MNHFLSKNQILVLLQKIVAYYRGHILKESCERKLFAYNDNTLKLHGTTASLNCSGMMVSRRSLGWSIACYYQSKLPEIITAGAQDQPVGGKPYIACFKNDVTE